MRIGFITTEFMSEPYFSGGLANYLGRVSRALVGMGHDVHVVTLSEVDASSFVRDGVHVHRVMVAPLSTLYKRLTRWRFIQTGKWLKVSHALYRRIRDLHRVTPFDVVQASNSRACGLLTRLLLRVPFVTRISCYRPAWNAGAGIERTPDVRMLERLEWLQLRLCRHVYAPSSALRDMLADRARIEVERVIRTPFFLETEELDPSIYDRQLSRKRYLLYFGRMQMHKGVHVLAQALPEVLNSVNDMTAVFVGSDDSAPAGASMREHIQTTIGEHASRVMFIDALPHSQLYPVISNARLVVLPSLIDNLPNTCLEAMALGRPVIGTRGASFDEVLENGRTGFLAESNDVEDLAAKIEAAWCRDDLDRVGAAARQKVDELAPEHVVAELDLYLREIAGRSSRA